MPVRLNHAIVWASDPRKSARLFAAILGRPEPSRFDQFEVVHLDNEAALDFGARQGPIQSQHYAFLIDDADFDGIFGRIREYGLGYWADPARRTPGEINRNDGGRGVYFADPDDHLLEVLTRPYGGGCPLGEQLESAFVMYDQTTACPGLSLFEIV